uniref:Uncharacterized protein n=1 Tax=Anguilla anguilla TaxID=7936 RepID=A0A0E9W179_ANGAN
MYFLHLIYLACNWLEIIQHEN